ncbi:MAG: 16S rRNA pseudouridine(516) synthase [Limnobacter sp.]|nr:16S rRNA pseudouridine(516) synthase [Limnobacter sp.]
MPINPSIKILQAQGLGSRKVCEKIFHQDITLVNDLPFDPSKDSLKYGDRIQISQESLVLKEKIYLMMNKPEGYETSHKPSGHPSVFDLLPPRYLARGVQAAGRLDVDTTGLLLLSDDGQFLHQMISGKKKDHLVVEKEYWITTARPVVSTQIEQLLTGVQLHDEPEPIAALAATQTGENQITMVITTGKYHQVKRMVAATGNHVARLHRRRVGKYSLPEDLASGQFKLIDAH